MKGRAKYVRTLLSDNIFLLSTSQQVDYVTRDTRPGLSDWLNRSPLHVLQKDIETFVSPFVFDEVYSVTNEKVIRMKAVIEANNKFTVDIQKALKNDQKFTGKNLFYSPSSLSIALAMTSMGAKGNTAEQMAKALHWEAIPKERLHTEEQHFLQALQISNTAGNELLAANRLFVQKNFSLVQEFVEGTKKFYDAETALVDYQSDAEGARKEVNQWVEKKTKQKIKNLIPEGVFNSRTRLTLVNAIYFKGFWQNQFDEEATFAQQFFLSETENVEVQMMHATKKFKHVEDGGGLGCQILELPYQGEDLSMVILLPHDTHGLAKLEEGLTHDKLRKALQSVAQSHPHKVEVSLPRFKLTQQFALKDILANMGATDMFDEFKADFSGITSGPEKLYVSHVIHKAFVEVIEKGTEAAAATAVAMMTKMALLNPMFCADHPFLFMICHNKSGAILFMGRLVKPESE